MMPPVLCGPSFFTLYDPHPTEMRDLGSNFFLTEADVGTPRATAVLPRLAELNTAVTIAVRTASVLRPSLMWN
jgi:ubiquitin-activating enzyme E1